MMTGLRTCPTCGKRRYTTRRLARKAAKRIHPGQHMSPYRCGQFWHIGHLPGPVLTGDSDRNRIRANRARRDRRNQ